jgi:ATP-dependent DNA helicase RecG
VFLRELTVGVDRIKGAGPAKLKPLASLGIRSAADLLTHYPRTWEDRSLRVPISEAARAAAASAGVRVCTTARVVGHDWLRFGGGGRGGTLKAYIDDGTGRAALVCFNRPFLEKQLAVGGLYHIYGDFAYKYGQLQSTAFEFAPARPDAGHPDTEQPDSVSGTSAFFQIQPVYPLSAGLTQNFMRGLVRNALRQYAAPLENELPASVITRDGLLPKNRALAALHFPASMDELALAKKTLVYEELFYLELMVGKRALQRKGASSVPPPAGASSVPLSSVPRAPVSPLQKRLIERLPFSLTAGQKIALADINRDMDGPYPMARLLQGDVGSGKTLVAFLAALRAVDAGAQAALMVPTELLARQHAATAARLLEPLGIRVAFLTGNVKAAERVNLLHSLAEGRVDIAIGTHALFSAGVVYKRLRLAVIDEQHRFGVTQRQAILDKGEGCGLLMMSATPIPRSLALTVFGDMDVSVIPDLPPGRKPVRTHLARQSNERKVYDFVRNELAAGRQAYFVYPLIEAGEGTDALPFMALKDAESMAERLSAEVFPGFPLALIHSKVAEERKKEIMESFRAGGTKILAATSVVEVGVDVPNATCMVIEHAERFGLSALHQLRGRVGRGTEQSFCFLVYTDALGEDGKSRLKVMLENTDGFVIAEEDLKLRGPGQIAGTEQSGYLRLGIADPIRDAAELSRARDDAFAVLEADPGLLLPEHLALGEVLRRAPPFADVKL